MNPIEAFNFEPGKVLKRKYKILSLVGAGWEAEVYKIVEISTGIERAAKFFFPHRNIKNRSAKFYAKKLHKLRHCPLLIQYHSEEKIKYKGEEITFLVSEYVEGKLLSEFLASRPKKRLDPYQAVHLINTLAKGLEDIHLSGEYHGDLHSGNVIVNSFGLEFDLKLLDFYHHSSPKKENQQDDICLLVRILYDSLGGVKHYASQPKAIKDICLGLKRSLILKKFPTMTRLCEHLETFQW